MIHTVNKVSARIFFLLDVRLNSVIFEVAPKYCISHSFVDYEGYSISFMGFLPTEVDIMVS